MNGVNLFFVVVIGLVRKVLVSFDIDSAEDKRVLLDLINRFVPSMEAGQQKLQQQSHSDKNNNVLGGDSSVFVPASDKQRALMSKYHIKFDDKTSLSDASDRITKYFNKLKNKGVS